MRVTVAVEQLRRAVPGGVGTYARGLLLGLGRMGPGERPEVVLHASRARGRPDPLAAYGFPVATRAVPGPVLTRLWDRGLAAAPGGRPGVVHSVSLAFPPSPRPLTVMVHDLAWRDVPEAFPDRGRRWHEAALSRALARAAVLLAPSEQTADALRRAGAVRVEVIPEGCDHLPAPDRDGARRILDRLGVSGGYLLSVGTLEPRKNLARLVEAYGLARPRLPEPWPLVVVGPAGWGAPDGEAGGPPAPGQGVLAAGRVDDAVLAALYEGARCLVYVPLTEGFGLPPVEAMAHGCPVVATPMPSTGGAAREVEPRDVAAMAGAIVEAAADGPARSSLVESGRGRAAGLSWVDAARRHVEVWQSLC